MHHWGAPWLVGQRPLDSRTEVCPRSASLCTDPPCSVLFCNSNSHRYQQLQQERDFFFFEIGQIKHAPLTSLAHNPESGPALPLQRVIYPLPGLDLITAVCFLFCHAAILLQRLAAFKQFKSSLPLLQGSAELGEGNSWVSEKEEGGGGRDAVSYIQGSAV